MLIHLGGKTDGHAFGIKFLISTTKSCINVFTYIWSSVVYTVAGLYLLQEASAVTGHGEVSQKGESELLDRAVIWGDTGGQLHDRVHQGVTEGTFRSWCNTRAAATKRTARWKGKKNKQKTTKENNHEENSK